MKNTLDFESEVDRSTGEITETYPIVKNWLNAHIFPRDLEENNGKSLSIPDQSLTVAEMLERQAKGLPISFNGGTPYFLGEEEMPDVEKMDLSEIQDLREFIFDKKQKAQEQAVKNREAKDKLIRDELLEYRRQKAAQTQTPPPTQPAAQEGAGGAQNGH